MSKDSNLSKHDLVLLIAVIAVFLSKDKDFTNTRENLHKLLSSGLSENEIVELYVASFMLEGTDEKHHKKLEQFFNDVERGDNLQRTLIDLEILILNYAAQVLKTENDKFQYLSNALLESEIITTEESAWLQLLHDFRNRAAHKAENNKEDSVITVFLKGIQLFVKLSKLVYKE